MRTRFDKQLEQLHVELIKMGSLCEQAITLAAQALDEPENDVVAKVAAMEGEIDEKEREIENICMRLLLQQQPVARDLRIISPPLPSFPHRQRL